MRDRRERPGFRHAHSDARNDIDGVLDVAIDDGVIAEVTASIDPSRAETVVDAAGLYVTPGLVDLHAHVFFGTESNAYLSNGYSALPPDGFTFRAGVTTVVRKRSAPLIYLSI